MKLFVLLTSVILILFIVLIFNNIINLRPSFICGDSKYFTFKDVEGGEIITNEENNQFRYDMFPSIIYQDIELKYPYRAYLKYNISKYIVYIGKDSNLDKQVSNLKNCYPDSEVTIKTLSSTE